MTVHIERRKKVLFYRSLWKSYNMSHLNANFIGSKIQIPLIRKRNVMFQIETFYVIFKLCVKYGGSMERLQTNWPWHCLDINRCIWSAICNTQHWFPIWVGHAVTAEVSIKVNPIIAITNHGSLRTPCSCALEIDSSSRSLEILTTFQSKASLSNCLAARENHPLVISAF